MNRSDLDRLRDARDFVRHARNSAGGLSAVELAQSIQPQHAALYDLVIVGETLHRISSEVKSAAPHLPWRATYNLRNLLVHAYWQADLENIARIIEAELEPLLYELDKLISVIERAEP